LKRKKYKIELKAKEKIQWKAKANYKSKMIRNRDSYFNGI
jgi:hypothetical protein